MFVTSPKMVKKYKFYYTSLHSFLDPLSTFAVAISIRTTRVYLKFFFNGYKSIKTSLLFLKDTMNPPMRNCFAPCSKNNSYPNSRNYNFFNWKLCAWKINNIPLIYKALSIFDIFAFGMQKQRKILLKF